MIEGIKRFRQAIKNQRDLGNGDLRLAYHDAEEIAAEIEDELLEICGSAEREIARYAWVHGIHAPVDADGEVVPLTTVVMYDKDGEEVRVSRFSLTNDGFEQNRRVWNARVMTGFIANLEDLHLHRPDSWERLEKDAKLAPRDYLQSRGMNPDKTDRIKTITTDIVRRAKALAERDAKGAER